MYKTFEFMVRGRTMPIKYYLKLNIINKIFSVEAFNLPRK
jgi:hypothetical protein